MPPAARRPAPIAILSLLLAGCAGKTPALIPRPVASAPTDSSGGPAARAAQGTAPGKLPPIPEVHGPLHIQVVYPDSAARIEVRDSTFVFGSVGDGAASLHINGASVPVSPNGAWLAWIPVERDSVITVSLEAKTPTDSAR